MGQVTIPFYKRVNYQTFDFVTLLFLSSWTNFGPNPDKIAFKNSGVFLALE